jgi:hypothetical protein
MTNERWPPLPYETWQATRDTLHMWTQVVGKVALATAPALNHSWGIAMQITPRGLTTRPLPHGGRSFAIEFDFIDHQLLIKTSDGEQRALSLTPRSVADFYREVMATLQQMNLPVKIWPVAVEVPAPIRLDEDTAHNSYDPAAANRFWRVLVQLERVFTDSRSRFVGKASPAHFFWGAFDLALSRFSGRPAPPREGPAFMREAYSHEVISHGFWPGSPPLLEPAFYAYAVPEPDGFKHARVQPEDAYYHAELGEFILPYEAVRAAASPEQVVAAFIDSTYAAGATLAKWDRASLERPAAAGVNVRAQPAAPSSAARDR